MVQEGVDGVLERNRAAGESNNPTHEGAPLLVSQQTRAARASHATATAQVGTSEKGHCRSKWAVPCHR
jgi:hypothetical protein